MFEKVERAERLLEEALAALDPEILEARSAARLTDCFARMERMCAAGKTLAARRVAASGVWRSGGERSPAHWLARRSGTTVGKAAATIETAQRLAELPATEEAVRKGRLSEAQSQEIASAAAASPSYEKELLGVASREGMATLKQRCARVRASATPDEAARHDAIFRRRYLRHYCDAEGAFRLDARLTPEHGAVVVAALEPFREEVFSEARKQGRRESYDAYSAEALVRMAEHARSCDNNPRRKAPGTLVRVLVDHEVLRDGQVEPGGVCEIEGIGPIPAVTVQALAQDSILAALATDGTDIQAVSHLGRKVTTRQRTALEVRDPCCVVPGCDVRDHLEIDHITGIKEHGPRKLVNLARLCPWHHYLKTYKRYRLLGGPGDWRFEPPDDAGPDPPPRSSGRGSIENA